ncbi:MAG: right-handed parallel beta-helix repeat-containing protein [Panacagrimonas sp.]
MLILFLLSPAVWSASYYVDSVAGKDTRSGLSESNSWKTIAKVNSATIPFGSTIYLKRNSVWHEQLDLPASGLTVDAYGSGALPTFDGSETVTGWKSEGSSIYSKVFTLPRKGDVGGLGHVTENGVFLKPVDWKTSASVSLGSKPVGSYTFQYSTNKLFIKVAAAPSTKTYRASTLLIGIHATGKSDILIQNVNFIRQSLFGIRFNDCMRCTARNSTISDGGGAVVNSLTNPYLYTGNGVEYSGNSEDGLLENLVIRNMYDSGVTPQSYKPNLRLARITFRNLTIERCGYAGVEISDLPTGRGSTLSDITVSGVTVRDSGRGWSGNRYGFTGHGILIQANNGTPALSGIVVENSTVTNSVGDGIHLSGEVGDLTVRRTLLASNNYGVRAINAPGTARTMKLTLTSSLIAGNRNYGVIYNSADSLGFNVFHNTLYDNGGVNFGIFRQNGQAFIKNNLFASSVPMTHLYVDGADALRGASVDNNCYVTRPDMIRYRNTTYPTLAAFNTATGFETGGVATDDPMFTNLAGFDFSLRSGSPCIARGATDTGIATDLRSLPYQTPPSMGALEYFASRPRR